MSNVLKRAMHDSTRMGADNHIKMANKLLMEAVETKTDAIATSFHADPFEKK